MVALGLRPGRQDGPLLERAILTGPWSTSCRAPPYAVDLPGGPKGSDDACAFGTSSVETVLRNSKVDTPLSQCIAMSFLYYWRSATPRAYRPEVRSYLTLALCVLGI